jgi:type IV secretory pathway VirB2 component (pilin)
MRKLALVFAAAIALAIVAGPFTQAANSKTLWEGWMEELQKAAKGTTAAPAKK